MPQGLLRSGQAKTIGARGTWELWPRRSTRAPRPVTQNAQYPGWWGKKYPGYGAEPALITETLQDIAKPEARGRRPGLEAHQGLHGAPGPLMLDRLQSGIGHRARSRRPAAMDVPAEVARSRWLARPRRPVRGAASPPTSASASSRVASCWTRPAPGQDAGPEPENPKTGRWKTEKNLRRRSDYIGSLYLTEPMPRANRRILQAPHRPAVPGSRRPRPDPNPISSASNPPPFPVLRIRRTPRSGSTWSSCCASPGTPRQGRRAFGSDATTRS